MARVDLTVAFQMFKDWNPTGSAQQFREQFYLRGLSLWCDDQKVEDVFDLRFEIDAETSRVTVWPRSGAWDKPPDAYRFETDSELFEQLLVGVLRLPTKAEIGAAILAEAARRDRGGETFKPRDLHCWQFDRFGRSREVQKRFYSARQIRRWIDAGEHRKLLK
jgi:hypothetical protein